MYKVKLNDDSYIHIRDLLTSEVDVLLSSEEEYISMKKRLTDLVFYDAEVYTMDDVKVGNITKKIIGAVDCSTIDGIVWGKYSLQSVKTEEDEIIKLKKELIEANETITKLSEKVKELTKEPEPIEVTLELAKELKNKEINDICTEIINQGVIIEFNGLEEQFTMTIEDQTNISALYIDAYNNKNGKFPYHSSGNLCRVYTSDEIIKIYETAQKMIVEILTLVNAYHIYINNLTTVEDVENIIFTGVVDNNIPKEIYFNVTTLIEGLSKSDISNTEDVNEKDEIEDDIKNDDKIVTDVKTESENNESEIVIEDIKDESKDVEDNNENIETDIDADTNGNNINNNSDSNNLENSNNTENNIKEDNYDIQENVTTFSDVNLESQYEDTQEQSSFVEDLQNEDE